MRSSKKMDHSRPPHQTSSRYCPTKEAVHASEQRKGYDDERKDIKRHGLTDRRRTQMRQAQRKYRFRKEATISLLRRRNAELENALTTLKSTTHILQAQVTALQTIEGDFTVVERLRDTTAQLLADIENAREEPTSRLLLEQKCDILSNYRIHSPMWQPSTDGHYSPRFIPTLGYEMMGHQWSDAP
ncbi:hypothetical protein BDV36DRAFT_166834 [Aspergillus pseudocaelatus]|uniref:BZIP domain-containing protein n=1 Tax=Aspergillus pseudocaelatus TaxID=1825620 RepID=A0ABQ6WLX8_9EURO|nr:hypothetical protein BDV36DRAFT_166834 [Aspergillus pseudocaelatus]